MKSKAKSEREKRGGSSGAAHGSGFVWIDAKTIPSGGNDYAAIPEGEYDCEAWVRERDGTLDIKLERHRSGGGFMAAHARGASVLAIKLPVPVRETFGERRRREYATRNWA